jgi:hypothetical protein
LARVSAIIIPSAAAATETLSTPSAAPGTVGLRLRLIDGQGAASQFGSVQGRDGFVGFAGIRHFDKGKAARTPGFSISDNADFLNVAVRREYRAQL